MSEISKSDWIKAQELLVKLAQTLSPLTQGLSPRGEEVISPWLIAKKLFVPPKEEFEGLSRHHMAVRLLPTLLSAQKEVGEWLEVLEDGKSMEKRRVVETTHSQEPFDEKEGSQRENKRGTVRERGEKKEPERPLPTVQRQESAATPPREMAQRPVIRPVRQSPKESPSKRTSPSAQLQIAQPAQKAIEEVRSAIRFLSTSSNLEDPKIDEFQRALQKIKPLIDQLVQVVETQSRPTAILPPQSHTFIPTSAPFTPAMDLFRSRRKEKKRRDPKEKQQDKDP